MANPNDRPAQVSILYPTLPAASWGVWDNRFKDVAELKRLGAQIHVDGKVAVIEGVEELSGAPITACDLRAGAALVIAGLCAKGTTELDGVYHIERGYENIVDKLRAVGADIDVVEIQDESEIAAPSVG